MFDLRKYSSNDLQTFQKKVNAEIKDREKLATEEIVKKLLSMIDERGINVSDVLSLLTKKKPHVLSAGRKYGPAPKKFKNKETGESWSGRGMQPRWLKEFLNNGGTWNDLKN